MDVFLPGVEKVGGFSMVSSPSHLKSNGELRLAVKYSTWPPAHWIHTKACFAYLYLLKNNDLAP